MVGLELPVRLKHRKRLLYTRLLCVDVFLTEWLNMSFEPITDLPTSWRVGSPFHRGKPVRDMTHILGPPTSMNDDKRRAELLTPTSLL